MPEVSGNAPADVTVERECGQRRAERDDVACSTRPAPPRSGRRCHRPRERDRGRIRSRTTCWPPTSAGRRVVVAPCSSRSRFSAGGPDRRRSGGGAAPAAPGRPSRAPPGRCRRGPQRRGIDTEPVCQQARSGEEAVHGVLLIKEHADNERAGRGPAARRRRRPGGYERSPRADPAAPWIDGVRGVPPWSRVRLAAPAA